jgi:hypothetical protein
MLVGPVSLCVYSRNKIILQLSVRGRKEVYMMHSHIPENALTKSHYYQNIKLMITENVNTYCIPFNYK